ncbi:ABC transporter substrate-binding protein [Pararhizobium sp. O133]|uniref:ABC transporter substrate-binding protein n=1 Tax=Pararhizobium sp. O133 TaxID=3449278 RepID=UPI003F685289
MIPTEKYHLDGLRMGCAAVAIASALLASTVPSAVLAQQFDREKSVIFANGGVVATLDPLRVDYAQTSLVASTIYDTLVTYDAKARVVGRLAKGFAVSDDVKSIKLTLRDDVTFHDGARLTAADVAYTLDRLKALGIGVSSQVPEYERTEIENDTTLTIHLSRPSSIFLGALSKIYILNSKLVQANEGVDHGQAWLQSNTAGTGPYDVTMSRGDNVIVSLVDKYWDPVEGRPQSIVFRRIDESATQRDEIIAGNVDLAVLGMGYRDAKTLDDSGAATDARLRPVLQTNVVFNTRVGPTADAKVRRAIRLAYDYAGGLKAIRMGNGEIANGVLPTGMPCRPELPVANRDLDEARKLLKEAGHDTLSLTMNYQPTIEVQRQEATLLQSNLREIGVELNLEPVTFAAYMGKLAKFDTIPQMMMLDDFAQFPDPGAMLFKGFRSTAVGTNRSGYGNKDVDSLLDQAIATSDEGKRCDLYKEAQRVIDADSPIMPMYSVGRPVPFHHQHLQPISVSYVTFPLAPADLRLKD